MIPAGADDVDAPTTGRYFDPLALPWARRALVLLKRRWQIEALPAFVRRLDRELTALACQKSPTEGEGTHQDLLSGKRLSKSGIRAALAKERFQKCTTEAAKLRARTELLCTLCSQ